MHSNEFIKLITSANLALGGGQFELALSHAKVAIEKEPKEVAGYYCAGKACMSLEQPKEAVRYFEKAVELDKEKGNAYFLLGYAHIYAGNSPEGLKGLTRAIENNCDMELKGQIYKMMSMINADQGDFENALVNLKQAESILGLDLEILQQQAACFASLRRFHEAIFTLNQMKMVKPKIYQAYGLAFHIFMELGIFDEAEAELERAKKYGATDMSYYNDRIAFVLSKDLKEETEDKRKVKCQAVLAAIDEALEHGQPSAEQVIELYLRAAQMYIAVNMPDEAIMCLDATQNPVVYFNAGFKVSKVESSDSTDDNEIRSPEEEEELLGKMFDGDLLEEIEEKISRAIDLYGVDDAEIVMEEVEGALTPLDSLPGMKDKKYVLDGEFSIEPLTKDMVNSLYVAAYEAKKDYNNMRRKAWELQTSDLIPNQYAGIYYELKVGKYLQEEKWETKYRDRINFWTRKMLEDPMDYVSAGYRIKSYIDIGDLVSAKQLCQCLPSEAKEALKEEISKAEQEA